MKMNKKEFPRVNSEAKFDTNITWQSIKQVNLFKYLGTLITRDGLNKTAIKHRIELGRKVIIGCLNGLIT